MSRSGSPRISASIAMSLSRTPFSGVPVNCAARVQNVFASTSSVAYHGPRPELPRAARTSSGVSSFLWTSGSRAGPASSRRSSRRYVDPLGNPDREVSPTGRPVARSHRDRRSAGRRSGVVSAYILNKNPSASSNSVKTASPCRGTFHEKYSATYVLKSSISSIVSMEPRKDWSGVYSRVYISGSFCSLSGNRGGLPDPGLTIASEA